ELSTTEMEDARNHVSACADCRNAVAQFERTRSMLKMSPDSEPPRHLVFEFEKPRPIWMWLVPAGIAAAIIVAVLIATPMQIQWRDSQLTIAFGRAIKPAPASIAPVMNTAVTPQPIDYDRIAKQVENSERAWILEELKKYQTEQMSQIRLLQKNVQ